MDKAQALNTFWNGFKLVAYDENSVPNDAALPYITYSVAEGVFNNVVPLMASIWYRGTGWAEITNKAEEIVNVIGIGGITVPYDNGALWITAGNPLIQRMSDPDDTIRRILINVNVEYVG